MNAYRFKTRPFGISAEQQVLSVVECVPVSCEFKRQRRARPPALTGLEHVKNAVRGQPPRLRTCPAGADAATRFCPVTCAAMCACDQT